MITDSHKTNALIHTVNRLKERYNINVTDVEAFLEAAKHTKPKHRFYIDEEASMYSFWWPSYTSPDAQRVTVLWSRVWDSPITAVDNHWKDKLVNNRWHEAYQTIERSHIPTS